MITLILMLIVIGLLVLAHEWGHFYAARVLGVKVEEFGFGFPPRIFSRVKKGVRYSFNLLPFGGFVKIFGEHGEGEEDPESFMSRPAWHRFIILAAGVFMNLVLAWVLFTFGAIVGTPQINEEAAAANLVSIIMVLPNSPAEKAGLKFGDQILEMRSPVVSLRIEKEKDVRDFVDAYRGEEVSLVIKRGKEIKDYVVTPRVIFPEGEGPLGIALAKLTTVRSSWYLAPWDGLKILLSSVTATVVGLYAILQDIFVTGVKQIAVSGPVGIFFFVQDSRSLGFAYFLQFIGVLSVNLAVLNFLPIPALDGGRILFLVMEKIRGRRMSYKLENLTHSLGFVILIVLMILVTYKDIARFL